MTPSLVSGLLFTLIVSHVHSIRYYDGAKWHCGINSVTETISEWLAKPFDYHGVNQCCQAHDDHYYHHTLSREDADVVFCNCLNKNANWFVRNLIEPVFCKSVQAYAIWQKVTNQDPWISFVSTTTTEHPLAYYLELLRLKEKKNEVKKEAETDKEWYLFQQFRKQREKFGWNQ